MKRKDIMKQWKSRDVSWSQLSSYWYSKQQWANSYLFNTPFTPNAGMIFGNVVGDTLGLGKKKSMVPKLEKHLIGEKEHSLTVRLNDRYLIGYADHYCPKKKILNENKTSQKKTRWNQVEVDNHGQLTMYALIILLRDSIPPEELKIYLNFIPVENRDFGGMHIPDPDEFYRYETKRTTKQCLEFGSKIERTLKEMEEYIKTVDLPA